MFLALLIILAVVPSAAIFALIYRVKRKSKYFTFRPHKWKHDRKKDDFVEQDEEEDFDKRHDQYLKIAQVVTTLASASLYFVPQLHSSMSLHFFSFCMTFSTVLLGESVLLTVLFMVALTFFYEESLEAPKSYTRCRYAFVNAFGFGGLVCFALAYAFVSLGVAWALGKGSILTTH
jgi:hypothetical protein